MFIIRVLSGDIHRDEMIAGLGTDILGGKFHKWKDRVAQLFNENCGHRLFSN